MASEIQKELQVPVPTHFKFTFRGVFLNTPETWVFGVHFNRNVGSGPDAGLGDVSDSGVTTALQGLFSGLNGPSIHNAVQAMDWRCYVIGTDGRAEGNIKVVDVSALNIKGVGTTKQPPQLATAVTTVADNRGPAKLGRFYLPGLVPVMGTDLRMSVTDAQFIAQKANNFLKGISGAIDLPGTIASSAGINVSTGGGAAGTRQDIDHCEVGRVVDTLRSRRRSMVEDRQTGGQIDW